MGQNQEEEHPAWNAYFSINNETVDVIIILTLITVINLKVSQLSAAGETKPSGSFCVGLELGLSSEELFLMPSI